MKSTYFKLSGWYRPYDHGHSFGRKWTVIVSTATFAIVAIATANSVSLSQLVVFRFLTGLGLGGALPNVIALASEYAPRRMLRTFVSALSGGMAVGAFVAGLASSVMIPRLVSSNTSLTVR